MKELLEKQKQVIPIKDEGAKPVALKIDNIDRGGRIKIKFNQPLIVPPFLNAQTDAAKKKEKSNNSPNDTTTLPL